jgi:hypothetical protein
MMGIAALQTQASTAGLSLPKTHVTDSVTNECYAFLSQAIALTHMKETEDGKGKRKAGRWIGPVQMAGQEDYGLESQGMSDYISFLKSLPIQNVILSAHLIDQYGFDKDEEGNDLVYQPRIVTGQKLSIRDKIGENIQTHFDHIFKFEREFLKGEDHFFVTFRGGIACTSYAWLPYGRHDWTKKPFYEFIMSFRDKEKAK